MTIQAEGLPVFASMSGCQYCLHSWFAWQTLLRPTEGKCWLLRLLEVLPSLRRKLEPQVLGVLPLPQQ